MRVTPTLNNLDGRSPGQQSPGKKHPEGQKPEHGTPEQTSSLDEAILSEGLEPQKLNEMVDSFRSDLEGQGLNASIEGVGPGLKVVLRDGSGSVIRQFSSQEFLRLRSASAKENPNRGKILDQKL